MRLCPGATTTCALNSLNTWKRAMLGCCDAVRELWLSRCQGHGQVALLWRCLVRAGLVQAAVCDTSAASEHSLWCMVLVLGA